MSMRLVYRFLKNGRSLLFADRRYIYQYRTVHNLAIRKKPPQDPILADLNATREQNKFTRFSRRILVDNVLNRVTSPKSSLLRAEATKKFAFGDTLPFLSLVACSLASGNGLITKEDELESICWEIREVVSKYQSKLEDKVADTRLNEDLQLSDLDIGPPIAKGCSAVVYGANFKNSSVKEEMKENESLMSSSESDTWRNNNEHNENINLFSSSKSLSDIVQNINGSLENLSNATSSNINDLATTSLNQSSVKESKQKEKTIKAGRVVKFNSKVTEYSNDEYNGADDEFKMPRNAEIVDASIYNYPWALKMMFNYDIQSNAMAILKAMYKETIPARKRLERNDIGEWENNIAEQTSILPPHPNLVLMPTFFCDNIPELECSQTLYPNALPARLNPQSGYGRNMSLFLLMKRYNCSLREYLDEYSEISIRTRIILFAQLLEAVAHINNFEIAHRDLKSDNILIDTATDSLPLLVLSDFGCCLADKSHGLRLPYQSNEIDKGGNIQLMAPEIVLKKPSLFSLLDYGKSDLWACGTIAYEIFGYSNPFYNDLSTNTKALRNVDYDESMLPELANEEIPCLVKKLIENILQRNPRMRLNCDVAANVLELYLWAPSSWIKYKRIPTNNEILEWLLSLTTKILCERGLGAVNEKFVAKNRRTYTEYVLISTFLSRAKLQNIRKALSFIQSI